MSRQQRYVSTAVMFLMVVIAGGCRRHVPPPPPPPPPTAAPPAAPTASLIADPTNIQRGQSATLRWSSQNATDLVIDPAIGRVDPQGTRQVSPTDSTTYTLTARGAGGSTTATARLTVTAAPAAAVPPPSRAPEASLRERFDREMADAFFDYDKSDVRADARDALNRSAAFLRANPNITIQIEGHCDERGSTAYNLGLGDRRANAARDFLVSLGINADRVTTISYGKEKPFCTASNEECWQQNRRAHLVCTDCGM